MQTRIYIESTPAGPRAQADTASIMGWGADLDPKNRPAYPKERTPPRLDNLRRDTTEVQPVTVEILHSNERPGLTPVFGTTIPPKGLSGMLRRLAFRSSENDLRHWLTLMLADRVNVLEGLLADFARLRPPNVLAEMGVQAEWRHNRAGFWRKVVVVLAFIAILLALLAAL